MSFGNRRRFGAAIAAGLLATGLARALRAQPQKVGRLVIGFGAGNPFDALARRLAESLRLALAMPLIVENRPGAGGAIAAEVLKSAPADGSVIWLSPLSTLVTEPVLSKVRYDPVKDFAPVSRVATFDIALAVGPAAPAKTLAEYVGLVRKDSSKGFFGTPAPNSLPHFFGILVGKAARVEMTNVSFHGISGAITATLGGQTPAIVSGLGDLIAMHQAGKLRVLATSGPGRSPFLPEVPTFKESGYAIEGTSWFGILVPATTPREVVMRVNRAVTSALASQELVEYLRTGGLEPAPSTPEAFAEIIKRDIEFWGNAIRASGVKLGH